MLMTTENIFMNKLRNKLYKRFTGSLTNRLAIAMFYYLNKTTEKNVLLF